MNKVSHTRTREQSSQPSQDGKQGLERKGEFCLRGSGSTLADPRGPSRRQAKARKAGSKGTGKRRKVRTAADEVVREAAVVTDAEGRWRNVERVVDTVELLWRRKQIDKRQRAAAETYRAALEACRGSGHCTLDTTRVRGGGVKTAPAERQLWGAHVLADAARILGMNDGWIVLLVVGEGLTIEEAAQRKYASFAAGKRATRYDIEHVGRQLREALVALADVWFPIGKPRILGMRDVDAMGQVAEHDEVPKPGKVVHATARRVYGFQGER